MKSSYIALAIIVLAMILSFLTLAPVSPIRASDQETHHLEVKPETLEGYRIPYMKVTVAIIDQETKSETKIGLHPMFGGNFHYGANVTLKPNKYLLRFRLEPPAFVRSEARKNQWRTPVDAEFAFDAAVGFEKNLKIGEKTTNDMKISFEAEHAEEMYMPPGHGHKPMHH